ncbi:MAG TPA: hypothetical protein VKG02_17405, partial [Blastocatellia bacterium]|nr:hypothetical protein [Blastocatellia bacterium]
EMEIGGDFEPRLDAAGQTVSFACGRGGGELTYNKLRVYDARKREVATRFELEGRRLAIVVEDGEAEYPVTIDPQLAQESKLMASDGAAFHFFGGSVAISGDTVVVGAPFAGAAYIFVRVGPTWVQQAKLTAMDREEFGTFGFSVAIDGDTVVVGSPGNFDFEDFRLGAAYIFVRDGTIWTRQQKLTARPREIFPLFGFSVAIDGDTVVVGADGAAFVFERSGTTWPEQSKLTASDGAAGGSFGSSVAIDGDTVVIGALSATIDSKIGQGAAYVFARIGTTWSQQQKLTASDGAPEDQFGFSVTISGDTVVVGATGDDSFRGAAYVFARIGTTWSEQQKLTASDGASGDRFGASVAIIFNTVVVGAPGANSNRGSAYVFMTPFAPGAFATVSAASYTSPVAPKEIVAGFGSSLAVKIASARSLPLPTILGGTRVIVEDSAGVKRAAPLYFISPSQINYQIPDGTAAPGNATVSVFVGPTLVAVGSVQIATTAPSIFALNASGFGPAAALDALTFAPAPFNAELADGMPNFIAVWGTGLGMDATDGGENVFASVKAFIDGNNEAQVTYAGLAPGFQGANQFNIQLPAGIASGEHKLTIARGGVTSNPVMIAISQ